MTYSNLITGRILNVNIREESGVLPLSNLEPLGTLNWTGSSKKYDTITAAHACYGTN